MTLTITENKFREKLTPLEEVEEIASCMAHLKSDAKLIAGLLGQTEQWVRLRSNIHKNLVQEWRQKFPSIAIFKSWSIGHLTLIARLPANVQKELLAEIKQHYWQWGNVSVQDLDRRISGTLKLLIKAKWNLDDETLLPKAGACSNCVKRSGNEPVLWFGAASDQIKTKDRCLDPRCWDNKMLLYLQQRAKQLSEKYSNLAYMATDYLPGDVKKKLTEKFGRVLDPDDVQKSTSGSKGSIPALVVTGKGMGSITFVKERRAKDFSGGKRVTGEPTPLKQRREMLKAKRWAQVLIVMREKIDAAGVDQVVYKDKITGIMALVAIFENQSSYTGTIKPKQKDIAVMVKKKDSKRALALLWDSFKPTLNSMLTYGGPVTQLSGHFIENARWIAELIQVDIDRIFRDVSIQKGFTVPKSWSHLNEDGTPKTAKKAKKKKSA